MDGFPILSILTFAPLVAAAIIMAFVRGDTEAGALRAKYIALGATLAVFVASLYLLIGFDPYNTGFQFVEKLEWMPAYGISYHKGVDGLSLWFVLISTFLTPICVISVWLSVKKRVREFMIALLVLETMMIGMFCALDFVLFYLFFEGVLIPMFLIVGIWGGPQRIYAAFKLFLFTFLGSVLMLIAIIAMYREVGSADMTAMMNYDFPVYMQTWLWFAFLASFAVKSPMWPLHTWLPYAHVEAPTAGSVILAGVLLKMGGYGLLRVNIEMLPVASVQYADVIYWLSIIAIIYTSLIALVQQDLKKLIAYSSVAHMGYVTLGAFTFNQQGMEGSILIMLSHTLVSSALFLCVGVAYDRLHTRELGRYGGMAKSMPRYALVFMVFMLASVGLPGTSGFVGEFLALTGTFQVSTWAATGAALGVVLGAAYMLRLYRAMFYGPLDKPDVAVLPDLNWREWAMFAPLILFILWMGVAPGHFSHFIGPKVAAMIENIKAANATPELPVQQFELQP